MFQTHWLALVYEKFQFASLGKLKLSLRVWNKNKRIISRQRNLLHRGLSNRNYDLGGAIHLESRTLLSGTHSDYHAEADVPFQMFTPEEIEYFESFISDSSLSTKTPRNLGFSPQDGIHESNILTFVLDFKELGEANTSDIFGNVISTFEITNYGFSQLSFDLIASSILAEVKEDYFSELVGTVAGPIGQDLRVNFIIGDIGIAPVGIDEYYFVQIGTGISGPHAGGTLGVAGLGVVRSETGNGPNGGIQVGDVVASVFTDAIGSLTGLSPSNALTSGNLTFTTFAVGGTLSHEIGHTLSLSHINKAGSVQPTPGVAPIMGTGAIDLPNGDRILDREFSLSGFDGQSGNSARQHVQQLVNAIGLHSTDVNLPEIEILEGTTNIPDNTGSVNYGMVNIGTSVSKTFTIKNVGTDILSLSNLTVPTGFSITTQPPAEIAAGESATFTVKLDATTAGNFTGSLSLVTNDPDENPYNFTIFGTVEDFPEIDLQVDGANIENNHLINFGVVSQNTPVSRVLRVTNNGAGPLRISSYSFSNNSVGTTTPEVFVINPGTSTQIVLDVDTSIVGPVSTRFVISNNDIDESSYVVTIAGRVLVGSGIEVMENSTLIPNNRGLVDFGVTSQGNPIRKTLTVNNTGVAALTLDSITLPAGFKLISAPSSIPVGQSGNLILELDAIVAGNPQGVVSIATNDLNNLIFSFLVKGAVTGSEVSVFEGPNRVINNQSIISFGGPFVGNPVTKTFTINNVGATSLTLGNLIVPTGFTLVSAPPASIEVGSSATFQIRLDAAIPGKYNGTVSFTTNDIDDNNFSFKINATVLGASIEVSEGNVRIDNNKGSVNFGGRITGDRITKTFTISNVGTTHLALGLVSVPPGFTVVTQPPVSIAEGTSATFQVRFNAEAIGIYNGILTFRTNDADDRIFSFNINGTVLGSEISVFDGTTQVVNNRDIISFGGPFVGNPVDKTFTLKNQGPVPLITGPITVPNGFTVISSPPSIIPTGGTGTFSIRFDALKAGPYNGLLLFSTNDADDRIFTFRINGTVLGSEISVFENATKIVNNKSIISFGGQFVGNPVIKTFTIKNTGNIHLAPGQITVPAGFTVITQPPASIPVGGSAIFRIQFDALKSGAYNGALSFVTNDADDRTFKFMINGTVLGSEISVFDDSNSKIANNSGAFDFGSIQVGSPVIRTFTIRNSGNIHLAPGQITVPAGFTVITQPPASIAVGGSATFQVRFNPPTQGNFGGALSFKTNDADDRTFNFNISGTALGSTISVLEGTTTISNETGVSNFGQHLLGNSLFKSYEIRNTGNFNLILSQLTVPTGFSVILQPETTIAPGTSTFFQIRFNPQTIGNFSGFVSINSNDFNRRVFRFNVNGSVVGR